MEKGTSSQTSSEPSYEVFLSFRGLDTRYEFTDCLYRDMVDAGILVFRDEESLPIGKRIGPKLLQAIKQSKIYIPIFSRNYASSHWCLRELAYMVSCTSESNEDKEILPIFFDVEPDDVKLKTNLYSQALSENQEKFCNEVDKWKKALIEVGSMKGWNWKKDQGQGELIRLVIRKVSAKLKVAYQNVTDHLVGVDDRVEDIIQKLDVGSDGVRFLKIHGMGGVGKTTLAKVVFNELSSSFDRCCFLADIRESSKVNDGLVNLQKQLLSNLLGPHSILEIYCVNDGINKIRSLAGSGEDRASPNNKKVLIVLDDVDKKEQLESLLGKNSWFGLGSRIIVTTRDKGVLSEGPNISTYEVCEMEFNHALKLFSRHAFNSDSPPDRHVYLSKEIVNTLGKLPLALEITGSYLLGKSEELWIDALKRLQETPDKKVQETLMITYEKLGEEDKEVFLDIACFFVNKDMRYPFYMWDDCNYHPYVAIDVLILMSLIKIKDNKTLWMHDQVRDFGRAVVRQQKFICLSERSRVWKREEALSILKGEEESGKIEALSVGTRGLRLTKEKAGTRASYDLHEAILTRDEFAKLRNLRFFEGVFVSIVGDFKNLLSKLRWLSWHLDGTKFETMNFHPANLVVLELSYSCVSEEWIGWDQFREAKKLKVLDLGHCIHLKRMPDLSTWVQLEILVLEACSSLIEINHSIGYLNQLKVLRMSGIKEITKLPSAIGRLEKLEELDARECCNLAEIPEEIGGLSDLRMLDLSSTCISQLPTTVSHLSNLRKLMLEKCPELRQLPELPPSLTCLIWGPASCWCSSEEMSRLNIEEWAKDLEHMTHLPTGNTCQQETLVTALSTSIGTLSQLKTLKLSCKNLQFLPQLPSSLRELQLRDLDTTRSLDFSNLKNLSILKFYRCSLEFCSIFDAESEELRMERCELRKPNAPLQLEMKRLRLLEMVECNFLPEVLDLSHMKNLQKVRLLECLSLVEICGLEELGSLYSLSVAYCFSLERMSDLSKLKKLRQLEVSCCRKLGGVQGLDDLESLKERKIHGNGEPSDVMLFLHLSLREGLQELHRWL